MNMAEKNKTAAMVISFILTGLGIAYLGNIKKGLTLFGIKVIFNCFGIWVSSIFAYIGILVWIYSLYETWKEAELVCS